MNKTLSFDTTSLRLYAKCCGSVDETYTHHDISLVWINVSLPEKSVWAMLPIGAIPSLGDWRSGSYVGCDIHMYMQLSAIQLSLLLPNISMVFLAEQLASTNQSPHGVTKYRENDY